MDWKWKAVFSIAIAAAGDQCACRGEFWWFAAVVGIGSAYLVCDLFGLRKKEKEYIGLLAEEKAQFGQVANPSFTRSNHLASSLTAQYRDLFELAVPLSVGSLALFAWWGWMETPFPEGFYFLVGAVIVGGIGILVLFGRSLPTVADGS